MKKTIFLFCALFATNFCLTLLDNPETLIEDSIKILEENNLCIRALPQYGYIYNLATANAQVINGGQAIPFSNSGVLTSGITFTPGSTQITLVNVGTYFVSFVVYATVANQFALFIQQGSTGVATPICNTNYGTGAVYGPNSGFAIITTTVANSSISLMNYTPFITQVNTVGTTTLAYNNNANGLICPSTVSPNATNVNSTYNSFNGGLEVNTVNAAIFIQQLA